MKKLLSLLVALMLACMPVASIAEASFPLESGSKGDEVARVQSYLIALGLLNDKADGQYGKKTAAAVEAFQEENGLEVTGAVEEEDLDALREAIGEQAQRAVIVAMTNAQATAVHSSLGDRFDPSDYYRYADTADFFLSVMEEGDWTEGEGDTWSVEDMLLQIEGYDSCLKLSCSVHFDGENYVLSDVSKAVGQPEDLDAGDDSAVSVEELEPSDDTPFLTVSPALLREDRGEAQPDSDEAAPEEEAPDGEAEEEPAEEEAPVEEEEPAEDLIDGMRPEFKEAMDDYEAFYDEYCEFLKSYAEDPTNLSLLAKSASLMSKAAEMDESFESWDEDDMNSAELQYYIDVNARVLKKLAEFM